MGNPVDNGFCFMCRFYKKLIYILHDLIIQESSLHKNRTSSEYSFNVEPNHEHATFLDKTLELYHSLERIMNPFENKEADEHYMDKIYGDYVYERLKYIKNPTVKHNLKLEIDKLFYNISKQ